MGARDAGVWVLVADEAIAKFLVKPEDGGDLVEVAALADPAAHAHNADLSSDAHGRRGTPDRPLTGVTVSAGEDPRRLEASRFAAAVAKRAEELHRERHYTRLRIYAAPRFLGLLRRELSPQVAGVVEEEQAKDYNHLDAAALTARLFPPPAREQR